MIGPVILPLLVAFLLGLLAGPPYIRALRAYRLRERIRQELPADLHAKAGTPTMGGWLIIGAALLSALALSPDRSTIWPVAGAMLGFGLVGAVDDLAKLRNRAGVGLAVRFKLAGHLLLALLLALWVVLGYGQTTAWLPLAGRLDLGPWLVPIGTLAIFFGTAGVNEVDGLDGLAAGTTALAFAALLALSLQASQWALASLCAALIGALLAFLWFNAHPAMVFMGDTGALALGAALGMISLLGGWVLLLPVLGLLYALELVSVIIQVAYFKATGGRRLFRMSPFHHHLQLSGWPEVQIVQRFWLLAALLAVLTVALGTL